MSALGPTSCRLWTRATLSADLAEHRTEEVVLYDVCVEASHHLVDLLRR